MQPPRFIAVAALTVATAVAISGCVAAKDVALEAQCAVVAQTIGKLRAPDGSGPMSSVDLGADPSIYQTAWKLRAAARAHIDAHPGSRASLERAMLRGINGPETIETDPTLEGLELRTTAALGLSVLQPDEATRTEIADAIEQYRVGNGYQLGAGEPASPYGTLIATEALHAIGASVPRAVKQDLGRKLRDLPPADLNSLDEVIVPVVASWAYASSSEEVHAKGLPLAKWMSIALEAAPSGQTLAIGAQLSFVAQQAHAVADVPRRAFEKLSVDGGWGSEAGGTPDPKATFYATMLGQQSTGLSNYLKSGRGVVGWMGLLREPRMSDIYAQVRSAEICDEGISLNKRRAERTVKRLLEAGQSSITDIAKACYISDRFNKPLMDTAQVGVELQQIAAKPISFDTAAELKTAANLCRVPIVGPVNVLAGESPSVYGVATDLLSPDKYWPGSANTEAPVVRPVPEGYQLLMDFALRAASSPKDGKPADLTAFECGRFICPISHDGSGDEASDTPRLKDQIIGLELAANHQKEIAIRLIAVN